MEDKHDRKSLPGGVIFLNGMAVSWICKLPMSIDVDNRAAIKQVEGEASSAKAKHINMRLNFVCEYARREIIEPIFVHSEMMLADPLTKALNVTKMMEMCKLLGLM